ncbi:MAG: hypothetical protein GKR91_18440 [Pseudomonadales bacterium]|nr:hypothetical protein [Pseudomonadales bacterium]
MTFFIFAGDMLVMAFMIGLAIWFTSRENDEQISQAANIPLLDECFESDAKGETHG